MNYYRKSLLTKYEVQMSKKQSRLKEVTELIPDYENLRNSETANFERRKLLMIQRNLKHQIEELKNLIEDLKTENDDFTPAE